MKLPIPVDNPANSVSMKANSTLVSICVLLADVSESHHITSDLCLDSCSQVKWSREFRISCTSRADAYSSAHGILLCSIHEISAYSYRNVLLYTVRKQMHIPRAIPFIELQSPFHGSSWVKWSVGDPPSMFSISIPVMGERDFWQLYDRILAGPGMLCTSCRAPVICGGGQI